MTALLLSDIPVHIATIEELVTYVGELYYFQYPGSTQLINNQGNRINYPFAQVVQFEDTSGKQMRRYELIVPVKDDAAVTLDYQWKKADEIDKVSPLSFPEAYKDGNLVTS